MSSVLRPICERVIYSKPNIQASTRLACAKAPVVSLQRRPFLRVASASSELKFLVPSPRTGTIPQTPSVVRKSAEVFFSGCVY